MHTAPNTGSYQSNDDPIKVAIDARPLSGSPCGYTIYLCSVIETLRLGNFDVTVFSNTEFKSYYPEIDDIKKEVFGSAQHLVWENKSVPDKLDANRFDIYFTGANRGIPLRKSAETRYVLGLLDIIPYLFFQNYFLKIWKTWLRRPALHQETFSQLISIARADAIVTISKQSAKDIARVFRRKDARSFLIRLKDVSEYPVSAPKLQFSYLGGIDYRKKVDVLLAGFAQFSRRHPGYKLFLIGSNYTSMLPLIEDLGLGDHVILTGYVDHDTKFQILSESQAMIYPSLYEGYGLAIGEAFQAGIPVIAGRGGSQDEVGGIGVRHIDPLSADDIAEAMEEMLDFDVRQAWISKGQHQLRQLTDPAIETGLIEYFYEQGQLARTGRSRLRVI